MSHAPTSYAGIRTRLRFGTASTCCRRGSPSWTPPAPIGLRHRSGRCALASASCTPSLATAAPCLGAYNCHAAAYGVLVHTWA